MNRTLKNVNRGVKQSHTEKCGNARERGMFGCPATPAPTPPGSVMMTRKAVVGAGLLDNQTRAGAGVKEVSDLSLLRIKAKVKVNGNGNGKTNTVENPPINLLVMKQVLGAGFSTPFPEGVPFGDVYLSNHMQGGRA